MADAANVERWDCGCPFEGPHNKDCLYGDTCECVKPEPTNMDDDPLRASSAAPARRENYDPGTDEHRAGRPSPPIPEGNVECWNCGAVIAWEGEPPTDCIRCGEAL